MSASLPSDDSEIRDCAGNVRGFPIDVRSDESNPTSSPEKGNRQKEDTGVSGEVEEEEESGEGVSLQRRSVGGGACPSTSGYGSRRREETEGTIYQPWLVDGDASICELDEVKKLVPEVDVMIPLMSERPWDAPEGFICLRESYMKEGRLTFPIPRPILDFCVRKDIALSQLMPLGVLDMVGLLTFGAELGIRVDVDFLERSISLLANTLAPGTFYTQGGFVTAKPPKVEEWQERYFFVRAAEEVVGAGAPVLRTEWNRLLGTRGRKDKKPRVPDSHDDLVAKIKRDRARTYSSLDKVRVEGQRKFVDSIPWASAQESSAASGAKKKKKRRPSVEAQPSLLSEMSWAVSTEVVEISPPAQDGGGPRIAEGPGVENHKRVRDNEEERGPGMVEKSSNEHRVDRQGRSDSFDLGGDSLPPPPKQRRLERGDGSSVKDPSERVLFSGSTLLPEKRVCPKPALPRKEAVAAEGKVRAEDVSREAIGRTPDSEVERREKIVGTRRMVAEPGLTYFEDTANPDHFGFRYRGEGPIVYHPEVCARWMERFPNMAEASEDELTDPRVAYQNRAAAHLWLLSMDNRLEGAHRARETALEQRVTDLQEAVQHRDEENSTLISDLALEKKRFEEKDGELAVQQVEAGGLREKVAELSGTVKGLNVKLAVSNERCISLDTQLNLRMRDLAEKTREVQRAGSYFRTRMQRLLRKQWRAHHRACWDRNRASKRILEKYLKSRKDFDAVDKLLSQAEGTDSILKSLITKGVSIPADVIAEVAGKVAKYKEAKAKLKLEEIYPDDFYVDLHEGLGVPDMEKIDLGVTPEEEGESSEEDPGIAEEESSEEDGGVGEDVPESGKAPMVVEPQATEANVTVDGGEKGIGELRLDGRVAANTSVTSIVQPTSEAVLKPATEVREAVSIGIEVHQGEEGKVKVGLDEEVSSQTLENA